MVDIMKMIIFEMVNFLAKMLIIKKQEQKLEHEVTASLLT
jgi:hypothetical protein